MPADKYLLSKIALVCLFPGIHVIEFYVFIYFCCFLLLVCITLLLMYLCSLYAYDVLIYIVVDICLFSLGVWYSLLVCC